MEQVHEPGFVDPRAAQSPVAKASFEAGDSYATISEKSGLPMSAVRSKAAIEQWVRPDGLTAGASLSDQRKATTEATLSRKRRVEQIRQQLAERLLADTTKLLDQLFEPRTYKEAKVVSGGQHAMGEVIIAEIEVDRPSHTDQLAIAKAADALIGKSQLLGGEATSRTEERTAEERKDRIAQIRDDLQERREQRAQAG